MTQAVGRVALPIFINLRPSPLIEREIKVLNTRTNVIFRGDPTKSIKGSLPA